MLFGFSKGERKQKSHNIDLRLWWLKQLPRGRIERTPGSVAARRTQLKGEDGVGSANPFRGNIVP